MANNNKKNTQKRKPAQSKNQKAKEQALKAEKREAVNRIAGVVLFAVSIIFFFVAVVSGEGAWHFVHNTYVGLFGYLASILFILLRTTDPMNLLQKRLNVF